MFNELGFATEDFVVRVYLVNDHGEFVGEADAQISVGTGLPARAFLDAPPAPQDGFAIFRENGAWVLVPDFRGTEIYETATRNPRVLYLVGPIPSGFTLLKPSSEFDVWDGCKWVVDETQRQQSILITNTNTRNFLRQEADAAVTPLQDAIDIDEATDDERMLLTRWKKYRVALNRIDLTAENIVWPDKP